MTPKARRDAVLELRDWVLELQADASGDAQQRRDRWCRAKLLRDLADELEATIETRVPRKAMTQ